MHRFLAGLGESSVVPGALPHDNQGGPGQDYYEEDKIIVFTKALTASQALADLSAFIDKTYDFVFLAVAGTSTGAYQVSFRDPGGREIYSSPTSNVNAVGTGQFPVPFSHGMVFPAGGKIGITLIDTSAAPNTVELCLIGVARYPLAQ